MEASSKWRARLPENAVPERRAHIRFRLALEVHFTVSEREKSAEKGHRLHHRPEQFKAALSRRQAS